MKSGRFGVFQNEGASNCPYFRAGGAAEGGYWSTVNCFQVCTFRVKANVVQFQLFVEPDSFCWDISPWHCKELYFLDFFMTEVENRYYLRRPKIMN